MTGPDCPEEARLQALLRGGLGQREETELSRHLDTCVPCQQTLEALAAGGAPAPQPVQAAPIAETALREAMARLKQPADEAPTIGPDPGRPAQGLSFLAPSADPAALGRFGPYEILEVIGRGGMGVVLKAFHTQLRRPVAVKVMAPHLAEAEVHRARFLREARAAAAVRHENVVVIHDSAEVNGLPYLVMEYVEGESLQTRLDREGALPIDEVLRIGAEVAAGLSAAHARGLIHRDVKPANLLVEPANGRVKITDFGLARAADDIGLTQSGMVVGTPQYMAPEQTRGTALDHRADLFSLGSVLYALCTGRPPFTGEATVAVLFNVCQETPRPIDEVNPAVPGWLAAVVEKLHAKDPADRFASAAEVEALLWQGLAQRRQACAAPPPGAPERRPAPPVSPPLPAWAAGREYRSPRTLWGWPLVHVATGVDPGTGRMRIARGVIAVGNVAVGGVAFGGVSCGIVAIGGGAVGAVALGGGAVGLLLAVGGLAVGGLALGGLAVGLVAVGGGAVGYYALGGGAWGAHAVGGNAQDAQAIDFFGRFLGDWFRRLFGPF